MPVSPVTATRGSSSAGLESVTVTPGSTASCVSVDAPEHLAGVLRFHEGGSGKAEDDEERGERRMTESQHAAPFDEHRGDVGLDSLCTPGPSARTN